MPSREPADRRPEQAEPISDPSAPARAPISRTLDHAAVRTLQQGAGNAAVARLLSRRGRAVLAREPEIEANDDAVGQRVVDSLVKANAYDSPEKGVHYAHNYQGYTAESAFAKNLWTEDCWSGYANPEYWERVGHMSWVLLPQKRASAAIKDWLAGPTIAECASVLVAIQLDTMRAAIGDDRFDELFSELGTTKAEHWLLTLNQFPGTSSTWKTMEPTEGATDPQGTPGRRNVKKGEWYYFYNHPKYLLKHPGGAFQGENAICMDDTQGAQLWSGFGVASVTEPVMLDEMADAYNRDRDERDYEILVTTYAPDLPKRPKQLWRTIYKQAVKKKKVPAEYLPGFFDDTIDAGQLIGAPEYTIDNVARKGGFQSDPGTRLSSSALQGLRTAEVY